MIVILMKNILLELCITVNTMLTLISDLGSAQRDLAGNTDRVFPAFKFVDKA